MAASKTVTESDQLKSLIISTASALWEDKDALGKFLSVVRRSKTFAPLADTLERSEVRPAKPSISVGGAGDFVSTCTGAEGSPRGRRRRRVSAEDATGPQLLHLGQTDSGEGVEQVGLGGADTVRGLRAGAKSATGSHAVIVRGLGHHQAPYAGGEFGNGALKGVAQGRELGIS
ncbi:hypothetical protein [Streptomyces misionensis]|uniref:hypothetical protein n=1 Tax=Streptomyces misionensis TaxID=67331 RepID=UPI0033FF47D6